jgi:hypothetical protein
MIFIDFLFTLNWSPAVDRAQFINIILNSLEKMEPRVGENTYFKKNWVRVLLE